jgi:hypothetical protein
MLSDDVRERLTPQMRDYYRMATIGHPFLMYFHELNFRSRSVNTDGYGLRFNVDAEGRRVTIADGAARECSLLVGGSTAFGVGATGDHATIASALAARTGDTWLNFGGRSFTSTQEFLLFALYRHKLNRVRRVVLFSGVNNLTVFAVSDVFPVNLGGFYFWKRLQRALHDPYLTRGQIWLRSWLFQRFGESIRWRDVGWRDLPRYLAGRRRAGDGIDHLGDVYSPIDDRMAQKELLMISLRRDLENWAALARAYRFELVYVLQPLASWVERTPSREEAELFGTLAKTVQPQFAFLDGVAGRAVREWYKASLIALCEELGIPFHDAADAIAAVPSGAWLWTDRAHLTDEANGIVSEWIMKRI